MVDAAAVGSCGGRLALPLRACGAGSEVGALAIGGGGGRGRLPLGGGVARGHGRALAVARGRWCRRLPLPCNTRCEQVARAVASGSDRSGFPLLCSAPRLLGAVAV
ncbi:MAG: hypothetical protein CMK50_00070 [Propionibacteriaceae bacterium]|nr:hypothetical protein [Propionibacteriaceae bacterium]